MRRTGPSIWDQESGADLLRRPVLFIGALAAAPILAVLIAKVGIVAGALFVVLPAGGYFIVQVFKQPQLTLYAALFMSFFASGLSRYVKIPWGLSVDAFLVLGVVAVVFQKWKFTDWTPLRNDALLVTLLWYTVVLFEIVNPEAKSIIAWFYAMRGTGFYQLLAFFLCFMTMKDNPRHVDYFLKLSIWISLLGTIWGIRQKYFWIDAAEHHWLYAEDHFEEHVLFGVLRTFSFYSDAGQFGASQAMFALLCGIITISPVSFREKIFYGVSALLTFVGFGISGTRGALAVPAAGGLLYLFLSKNFKILITGLVAMFLVFYMLKYTKVLQGVEQVRRMRTALADDNPSLQVRLDNQILFGNYLRSRPFGGGIGSSGFWGARFSPGTFLGEMPTDSYYVKIWAETGIIGICVHMFMLAYFLGKGGFIIWHLKNDVLRFKMIALYASYGGVLLASYGNQVFSQLPSAMMMNIGLPMIFMAPRFDRIITAQKQQRKKAQSHRITPSKHLISS